MLSLQNFHFFIDNLMDKTNFNSVPLRSLSGCIDLSKLSVQYM